MKANSSAGSLCEDQLVLIREILTFFSFDVNKRCKNGIESYYNNEKICSRFQGFCCPGFWSRSLIFSISYFLVSSFSY